MKHVWIWGIVPCLLCGILSCSSGRPAPHAPELNPQEVAQQAMALYDRNGDGKIDGKELEASPALKSALDELDTNRDKELSAEEIASRIEQWNQAGDSLETAPMTFQKGKKPLASGKVTLIPEPFLGEDYARAEGVIADGICTPAAPNPGHYQALPRGFYTVEITEASETIPDRKRGVEIFSNSQKYRREGRYLIDFSKK